MFVYQRTLSINGKDPHIYISVKYSDSRYIKIRIYTILASYLPLK